MKIFLSGATGFVGRHLILRLLRDGHEITAWVRNPSKASLSLGGEVSIAGGADSYELPPDALDGFDAVINLAGEPIAGGRWTKKRKLSILKSRVETTKALVNGIKSTPKAPHIFISASAIGYYGSTVENDVTNEHGSNGNGFLPQICAAWEAPLSEVPESTRVVTTRIGLVLGLQEGLLGKLTPVFDAGVGGVMGSGRQMMSWIHITDLVEIIATALTNKNFEGPINCVAPNAVSHEVFCKTLAKVLNRPCLFGVPSIALQMALGESSQLILDGAHITSEKLPTLSFQFEYENLHNALTDIFGKKKPIIIEKRTKGSLGSYRLACATIVNHDFHHVRPFFFTPKSLAVLSPPGSGLELLYGYEEKMRQGTEMAFKIKMGPIPQTWVANIEENNPEYFIDTQVKGPMRYWHHKHSFTALESGTELRDEVNFSMPLGFLGKIALELFAKNMLQRLFVYRNHMLKLRFGNLEGQ